MNILIREQALWLHTSWQMLSVPCCFILPTYRTCRSIKEADEVPADDGVADIEQDACDAFLTRAEPCGGCDVLLREGVALFRGFQCGNLTARFWPIDIRRLAPLFSVMYLPLFVFPYHRVPG